MVYELKKSCFCVVIMNIAIQLLAGNGPERVETTYSKRHEHSFILFHHHPTHPILGYLKKKLHYVLIQFPCDKKFQQKWVDIFPLKLLPIQKLNL